MQLFEDVERLQGQTPADRVEPRAEISDVLVFALPGGVQPEQTRYLRLVLPGGACDCSGSFRFEIPIAMIEGWTEAAAGNGQVPEQEARKSDP